MKQTNNFDKQNNGELMGLFYGACQDDDVALRDQVAAAMAEREYTVDYDGQHNPSWTDHNGKESVWSRLFG